MAPLAGPRPIHLRRPGSHLVGSLWGCPVQPGPRVLVPRSCHGRELGVNRADSIGAFVLQLCRPVLHSSAVWGRPLKDPTHSSSTVPAMDEILGYLWQEMFSHFVPMPCMSNVPWRGRWQTVLRYSSGLVPCIIGLSHSAFSTEIYSKAWTAPSERGFKARLSFSK